MRIVHSSGNAIFYNSRWICVYASYGVLTKRIASAYIAMEKNSMADHSSVVVGKYNLLMYTLLFVANVVCIIPME